MVVLDHVLDELVGVLARLLRATQHVLGQLLLLDGDLLALGQLVEHELGRDRVARGLLQLALELVDGLLLGVEVGLELQALHRELLLDVLAAGLHLGLDQRVGDRHLDQVEDLLHERVAGLGGLLEALAVAQAHADVVLELGDGVELRGHLGELVVEVGELLLLDPVDGDRDLDGLAGEVAAGQGGLEGRGVAGGLAGHGLVEAVDHAAAADLVADAGGLAALDGLAVLGRDEVEHDVVALGGRPVDVDQGAEALAEGLDLGLDVLVGDDRVGDRDLEAGQVGQLDRRADVDLRGELQRVVVVEAGDVDLGLRQRLQVVVLEGLDVELRERVVDRLVQHRPATDLAVDDGGGDLALAEPGDVDLLRDLAVRRVQVGLQLGKGHLDGELGPGGAQSLDGALHRCTP